MPSEAADTADTAQAAAAQPIKIAILAMGGEGGGVLADWIVGLAESQGFIAQATSVPGVAQRTGATIYYLELFPRAAAQARGRRPVLALMPLPGDVDIVIASELMEAARAVQRGLVTPERTTLVASTHRVYAITEKIAPGDGRADATKLLAAARWAARRFVGFDMAGLADEQGSVISAVLFGALAGSGALPFAREAFEATISRGGVGVASSLAAFGAACARVEAPEPASRQQPPADEPAWPTARDQHVQVLLDRARRELPREAHAVALEGLRRLVDHQDVAYAALYLDRLTPLAKRGSGPLAAEVARHLALWMAYEDAIRVADLKTRVERVERVRAEARVTPKQLLAIDEFLHPRLQEVCDVLPAGVARWLLASRGPRRLLERLTSRGRVVTTNTLRGYLLLRAVAALRRWRRASHRYAQEQQRIGDWLRRIEAAAGSDDALAVEIARCQRLVKGYGDTHARGWRKFELVMAALDRAGGRLPAAVVARLVEAALADEEGRALAAELGALAPKAA